MQKVTEIIGESFERALGIGKCEDSSSNAFMVLLRVAKTKRRINTLLEAIDNCKDEEEIKEHLASYFRGEITFVGLEKKMGITS